MSGGRGASKRSGLAADRVDEAEARRVQRLAREAAEARPPPAAAAVDGVADQRMPGEGHVHPDLVRAAGLEPAFDERRLRSSGRSARGRGRA